MRGIIHSVMWKILRTSAPRVQAYVITVLIVERTRDLNKSLKITAEVKPIDYHFSMISFNNCANDR